MNIILSDAGEHLSLLPLTYTRPVADIRIGIDTIREKWARASGAGLSIHTQDYLQAKFPMEATEGAYLVRAAVIPDADLVSAIRSLQPKQRLFRGAEWLATALNGKSESDDAENVEYKGEVLIVKRPWDIFHYNGTVLTRDFDTLTNGRTSEKPDGSCKVIGNPDRLFIEEGATVLDSTFNTTSGPIYIGKDAQVMEGSRVRGPFALCEHGVLKMDTKIYGPTTIGPYCKCGGEINNSVIFGYSNKGHDGFMGNSVIAEWCNLGADTNTSNLKNNYGPVKVWNYADRDIVDTGLQFCGTIMGDHSKTSINTMLNTGTIVGVCANIYGGGFPPKFIPSFSWGSPDGFQEFRLDKAYEVAERMMERRSVELTTEDREILQHICQNSSEFRK